MYLQHYCLGLYENELSTYKRLQDFKGSEILQLSASVNYLPCIPDGGEGIPPEFMEVKDILIEFISGAQRKSCNVLKIRRFYMHSYRPGRCIRPGRLSKIFRTMMITNNYNPCAETLALC